MFLFVCLFVVVVVWLVFVLFCLLVCGFLGFFFGGGGGGGRRGEEGCLREREHENERSVYVNDVQAMFQFPILAPQTCIQGKNAF